MAAGSLEVTQRGAGVNMSVDVAASTIEAATGLAALVQGDAVTGQGLYPIPAHTAVINEVIGANASGNPRVDRVILELKDTTHDASGSNLVQTRVVAGTPTGGATLDNLSGAAAVPASALLLADVLVANGAASIANSVIRDRRKWARGAYCMSQGSGSDQTTTSTGFVAVTSVPSIRIELSGVPVRVTVSPFRAWNQTAGQGVYGGLLLDGVGTIAGENANPLVMSPASNEADNAPFVKTFTPSAGSHIIQLAFAATGGTAVLDCALAYPCVIVEELVRQNTRNNTTTTG